MNLAPGTFIDKSQWLRPDALVAPSTTLPLCSCPPIWDGRFVKGVNRRRYWELRCKLGREPACPKTIVRPSLNPRARCARAPEANIRSWSQPSQAGKGSQKANIQKVSEYVPGLPGWITRNYYTAQRCDDMTISQVSLTAVSLRLYRTYILSPHRGIDWVSRSDGPGPSLRSCNLALYIISGKSDHTTRL